MDPLIRRIDAGRLRRLFPAALFGRLRRNPYLFSDFSRLLDNAGATLPAQESVNGTLEIRRAQ